MNIGHKIGILRLISKEYEDYFWKGNNVRRLYGIFDCECGKRCRKLIQNIKKSKVASCGCMRAKLLSKAHSKTGQSQTKFGQAWINIRRRCNKKTYYAYPDYGGRGIKCSWATLESFYDDMFDSYNNHIKQYGKKNTTIERIDNDSDYCKENCKRATWLEQGSNKRNTKYLSHNGKTMSVAQRSRLKGVSHYTISARIRRGWTVDQALNYPLLIGKGFKCLKTKNG